MVRGVAFAQFDRAHGGAVEELDPQRTRPRAEEVLEAAAVDLPGRCRQRLADPQLGAAVEFAAALAEEEPETELAQLRAVEVLAQAEDVGEVMGADLDRGLADLERGLAHRVAVALQHRDPDGRIALAQRRYADARAAFASWIASNQTCAICV